MTDNFVAPPLAPLPIAPREVPVLWGGEALVRRFGKPGDPNAAIGESWECWDDNRSQRAADSPGATIADAARHRSAPAPRFARSGARVPDPHEVHRRAAVALGASAPGRRLRAARRAPAQRQDRVLVRPRRRAGRGDRAGLVARPDPRGVRAARRRRHARRRAAPRPRACRATSSICRPARCTRSAPASSSTRRNRPAT